MFKELKNWQKILITLCIVGIIIYFVSILLVPLDAVDFYSNYFYSTLGHLFLLLPTIMIIFSQRRGVKITFGILSFFSIIVYLLGFMLTSGYQSLVLRDAEKFFQNNPSLLKQCEKYEYGKPEWSIEGYDKCRIEEYRKAAGASGYFLSIVRDAYNKIFGIPLILPFLGGAH